ncbi:MAG TPA: serine hydrolase domain-containing protein [Fimbriimonadaceae bacterium]|nr:serine hydrolase domain-containing protein [Fimbriimonadaceae bacterium]
MLALLVGFLGVADLRSEIDATVQAAFKTLKPTGMAVAVVENGKPLYVKGLGFADLEQKRPMTADSVHYLASLGKHMTATAILLLEEDGKLKLDDSITTYLKDAPETWKPVTVRHLLHHSGGLPDYLTAVGDIAKEVTDADLVASIKDKPVLRPPGEKWQYSNTGYMLLGLIAERVSGQPLGEFLHKRVWGPSKMNATRLNDPFAIIPNRARGTMRQGASILNEAPTSRSLSKTGDGPAMSSLRDLMTWDQVLSGDRVLSKRVVENLFAPDTLPVSPERSDLRYAAGWMISRRDGRLTQSHGGGWVGTTTLMVRVPAQKRCVIVLVNQGSVDVEPMVKSTLDRLDSDGTKPKER